MILFFRKVPQVKLIAAFLCLSALASDKAMGQADDPFAEPKTCRYWNS